MRTVQQNVEIPGASRAELFRIFVDSERHSQLTGAHALIDPAPGGAFTRFDGAVRGTMLLVVPDRLTALLGPPVLDQDVALLVYGEREQVSVAEALADRGRVGRGCDRGLPVAGALLLEDQRQQQIATLDAVAPLAIEQPLGAAQPPGRAGHLPPEGEVDADPERTPDRPRSSSATASTTG